MGKVITVPGQELTREDLATYDGKDRVVSNLTLLEEFKNLPPVEPIDIGFPTINEWIGGVVPGELVVIGGLPKSGKSTLMKTCIRNFSNQGRPPLVFSFEEQMRQFFETFDNKSQDILFYLPKELKAYDVNWICQRTLEAKDKLGIELVMIDHGHFLFEMSGNNSSLDIGDCARKLKRMAVDEGLVVFLIWHLKKPQEEPTIESLDKSMLRDSGMLACELDTLLFNHRESKSEGLVQTDEGYLKVDCTRRTGIYKKYIPIKKVGNYFEEVGGYL